MSAACKILTPSAPAPRRWEFQKSLLDVETNAKASGGESSRARRSRMCSGISLKEGVSADGERLRLDIARVG